MPLTPTTQDKLFAPLLTASVLLHALVYILLGTAKAPLVDDPVRQDVSFEVIQAPLEPTVAAEAPAPEPEPEAPAPTPAPRMKAPPPEPDEPPPPPPPKEVPVDFGNLTMTNEGTSSWAVQPSSGVEQNGPIAGPGKNTGRSQVGVIGGTGDTPTSGPAIVAAGDLARRPSVPDNLNKLLEEHYPKRARAEGVQGTARVKVRLLADGSPKVMAVLSESAPLGFGEACKATLAASPKWTPGVDKNGRPAATEFPFTCHFEIY